MIQSRPTFCGFSPDVIKSQRAVIDYLDSFDFSKGNAEILLSGSYGSAKSILISHLIVKHCLKNKRARVGIGRMGMPDLKRTLWREILEHIHDDFIEGVHYSINRSTMTLKWKNGSEIICLSWADQLFGKFRSLNLSMIVIEELTEDDTTPNELNHQAFKALKSRLRRLPHVKENLFIAATNPSAPSHWAYKYFIEGQETYATRKVFYSRTEDNPYLDPVYISQLRQDLSPKEAERYLDGKWVEIAGEVVYYEYRHSEQFRRYEYKVDPAHPIGFTWDFNIGEGKPMSLLLFQFIADEFHFFDEVIIQGARTADTLDEAAARGYFRQDWHYVICGDASGKNRDTRSLKSDYEIIRSYFDKNGMVYQYLVPPANPPVRTRHNRVNAYCRNALGQTRLWVYEKAKTLDEGLRLVKLKPGANYIEDDSKHYQHCTTAAGYALSMLTSQASRQPQRTVQL
jgi:hypothetical protein